MALEEIRASQAELPVFVGVDVGGTSIKLGWVDNQGRTLVHDSIPTQAEKSCSDAIRRIAERMGQLAQAHAISKDMVAGVGLATPGTMDLRAGLILEPPNIPGWRHFPIREGLQAACGYPVTFSNDATAAGFGEYWVGRGRDVQSLVLLTLGTGVGGGIILDGRTLDGAHDHGSEIGHVPIDMGPQARWCGCGQRGHIEAYCSATAVAKRALELLESPRETTIRSRLSEGTPMTTRLLYEEAERGDSFAWEVILEAANYLAVGIISVAHSMDPELIVLGGAMDFGGENDLVGKRFLEHVRSEFRKQTFPVLAQKMLIDFAALGGNAGYIGAAGLAREAHYGRQSRLY